MTILAKRYGTPHRCFRLLLGVQIAKAQLNLLFTDLQEGWTPLMTAALSGQLATAQLLVEHKANVNFRSEVVSAVVNTVLVLM